MGTNMGKMFLEGDLAKAVRSLKIYLTFDTVVPFLGICSVDLI